MIRLVKTTGGSNGAPPSCKGCGGLHFVKSGVAWHCEDCKTYFPVEFNSGFDLKKNLEQLQYLHSKLKFQVQQLEDLVKE